MFLPKISRLIKKSYNTFCSNEAIGFWSKAVAELEKKLRYPHKSLTWREDNLSSDLRKMAGDNLTVYYRIPYSLSTADKKKAVLKGNGSQLEAIGHKMTLRSHKKTNGTVVACDPGGRTFLTLYDLNNNILEIGCGDIYKISHDEKTIRDIHKRIINYLINNFGLILIPKLDISTTDENLLSWRHTEFIERLLVAAKTSSCKVVIVTEEYTSKTCSSCGKMSDPGKSKTFKCEGKGCGIFIDRDVNGARNILLKNMAALGIDIK